MEEVVRMRGDSLIVERARHGDAHAFEAIYREYQPQIAGYLCRMVRDPELAADLTQDVFINAYKAIGRTQPGLNLRAWLFTIATNAALSHHRRRRVVQWSPLDERGAESPTEGPEDRYAAREELSEALHALPPEQSACLLLSARDGFTYEEIARMLGISEGAAKTRAYRARMALARALRSSEEGART
jgi:RNA polymerase sigma-70 factor (ECF subfamily)